MTRIYRIRVIAIFALILCAFVPAALAQPFTNSADTTTFCRANGESYAVAAWTWNGVAWTSVYQRTGYVTSVTGPASAAQWTSNMPVREAFLDSSTGVVSLGKNVKTGSFTSTATPTTLVLCEWSRGGRGGSSGVTNQFDVDGQRDGPADVPEFGTVALIAVGLLSAGLVFAKRR